MDGLNNLLNFISPGCTLRVQRAADAVEGDPWPGVELDDAKMQAALDNCVEWAGMPACTGVQARAAIPAWQASLPTAAEVLDARIQERFDNEKAMKALAIWVAQKLNIPLATARSEIIEIYKTL